MTGTDPTESFRLAYVPGVTPDKWARTWRERLPDVRLDLATVDVGAAATCLRDGSADACLLRAPIADRTGLSAIPLYTEKTVVIVPKDHEVAGVDELSVADLADYIVLHPVDDSLPWEGGLPGVPAKERPASTADAVELVAAGVGLLVVPQSLARLHHRKDLTYRTLTDAPQSSVALSWLEEQTTDLMEEFIGIVRGRTVNSSRGRAQTQAGPAEAKPKRGGSDQKQDARQKQGEQRRGGGSRATGAKGAGAKGAKSSKGGKPRRRG